jgi:hypothetical protein
MAKGSETNHDKIRGLLSKIASGGILSKYENRAAYEISEGIYDGFPIDEIRDFCDTRNACAARVLASVAVYSTFEFSRFFDKCTWLLSDSDEAVCLKALTAYSLCISGAPDDAILAISMLSTSDEPIIRGKADDFIENLGAVRRSSLDLTEKRCTE